MIRDCVVDASVGIKLFVKEVDSQKADLLFSRLYLIPAARFYVPDLFYVECANILWKYVRRFGYPADNAHQDVGALQAIAFDTISTANIIADALDLALLYEITAYDASYLALAIGLDLPLVTADEALVRKLQNIDAEIVLLKSL